MKKVIVIYGSEDGVLGVAGNIKRAVEMANESGYPAKYKEVLKGVKAFREGRVDSEFIVNVDLPDQCSLRFESFYLNN